MKFTAALSFLFALSADAFAPASVSVTKKVSTTSQSSLQASSLDSAFGVGIETGNKCPPLGAWILEDANPSGLKWFQNAEIKHGRIAMIATIGFMVQKFGVHFPLYLGPSGSNVFHPASDQAWLLSSTTGVTFSDIATAAPLDAIKVRNNLHYHHNKIPKNLCSPCFVHRWSLQQDGHKYLHLLDGSRLLHTNVSTMKDEMCLEITDMIHLALLNVKVDFKVMN